MVNVRPYMSTKLLELKIKRKLDRKVNDFVVLQPTLKNLQRNKY